MSTTTFRPRFFYTLSIFTIMPLLCIFVLWLALKYESEGAVVPMYMKVIFAVFAVVFAGYLIYFVLFETRKLKVKDGEMIVCRAFGLIEEGRVKLDRYDGYFLDYVRTGRKKRDVFGYFCLLSRGKICTRICFNNYSDFDIFLHDAIEPIVPLSAYRKDGNEAK